ncbi:MAG: cadherin domain-containing protein, partial [Planctomycetota bacterium]
MFAESFDGVTAPNLPAGWSQTSTGTNAWNTVAGALSHSAPNHAFVANPSTVSDARLTSAVFVPTAGMSVLNFRNFYDTEDDWDGGVLEISINGGGFSDILVAGGSFLSGGYTSPLNASDNPLSLRPAWHGNSGGFLSTVVRLPDASLDQNSVLRWRFGSDGLFGDVGWRIDTVFLSAPPTLDFGDAPDSYPVLLSDDGARHTVGSLFLGSGVDPEFDGSHSVEANDDGSDENGITFTNPIAALGNVSIEAVSSQAGGLLNAWLDFNRDGDWSDPGEQIFADRSLTAGVNTLNFAVPADAKSGPSYARFRLSTNPGLTVTGLATDGEVEDYRVTIATPRTWIPLGPFSATNGQVENMPKRPISGAMHTVLAHPTNANILYAGSVNGGVWKTTNATDTNPHWVALTDALPSQSIGALTFDLADGSSNTIFAGTGRYSSFGREGNRRVGLYKSTNGGQTWQVIDGGGILAGKNISGVYANGNTIVVSVNVADSFTYENIGIFRSTNGGASFTQMSVGNGAATGLPGGVSYDLVYDPINPNILYTSTVFSDGVGGLNGVYKSTNAGATWTRVSTPAMNALIVNNTSNLELAAGRNNEVYAAIINAGAFAGLFRSPDNGVTWVQMDSPRTNENGIDVGLNPSGGKGPTEGAPEGIAGGQGAIHFAIVADPTNANIVYVGGDRQPRSNGDAGTFPNSIGALDFTGRLFRGDASRPAGTQFVHLTHSNALGAAGGGTASSSSPHADSREMTFDANGDLIEVDDGGIYRRTSPRTNTGDWFSINGTLQVTEAHDVAWDSLNNVAMTGNQDTGTTYQTGAGASLWDSLSTADGGDVAVDNLQLAGANQSVRYSSFQNLGAFRQTIWGASGELLATFFPTLTLVGGGPALARAFRTPLETNNVAGGRLLIQGTNGLYESTDSGATITSIGNGVGVSSIATNAIVYGGTKDGVANPDLVWAASSSNVFVRTAGTGNVVATPGDPTTATIRDLAVNSRDWANAYVIDDNQVFQTVNTGGNWTDITGDLMSFATDLRSITHVANAAFDAIIVGTNAGVYATLASAIGEWFVLGSGFPNALVYDMDYDATDDVLVSGTLGRGAWMMESISLILTPNQPPIDIGLSATTLPENAGSNALVGVLNTLDFDPDQSFTYSLVAGAGSTDNAAFNIDGSTLRATNSLDFELKSTYLVRIRSTDLDGLFVERAFTITLTNVNETPTSINVSSSSITENAGVNATVGVLSTADPDAANTFTYTLVAGTGDVDNAAFNINGAALRATNSFDFETKPSYTVRVRSTDQGGLFTESVFTISVVNVNEAPSDIGLSNASIAENSGPNATVGAFSTTDIDFGNTFTYALVGGTGGGDNGSFNISGSTLRATNSLNFEAKSSYSVRVRSTDQGGLFTDKVFLITVTDVNEAPSNITLSSTSIAENAGDNATVGTFSTIDADAGNTFTYSLVAGVGGGDNGAFNIVGNSLRATNSLDFEAKPIYAIRVRSTDQGGLFTETTFTITVTNVNETPIDIGISNSSVAENAGVNATVGTLSTVDVDAGNTFTYSLVAGAGDADNGAFNLSGAILRATSSFDFEARSSYSIRIRSTDQGGLFTEKAFVIAVTNANEAPVDIVLLNGNVPENAGANATAGVLSTIDIDTGNTFTYTLVTGAGDSDNAAFFIVADSIRTIGSFNFEARSSYNIRVRSTDQGGLFTEKALTIAVTDVNEAPTIINLSNATIPENAGSNVTIGNLSTIDIDAGNSFTYTLVPGAGDTDNAAFNIVGNTLRANNSFDYEANSSYIILVRSTDQGGLFVDRAFAILVTNVNEVPTNISLSNAIIPENAGSNTTVGTLSTADPDEANTFTYNLVSGPGDTDNSAFNIVGSTLRATNSLDFDAKSNYTVRVRSTDQGGLFFEKEFTISLTNVNESPTNVSVSPSSIAENAGANSTVGTLSTTDPDFGNTFTYALVTGAGDVDNSAFNISGSALRATNSFNFESKSSYTVRVRSTDQGGLFTERALTIGVVDINEPPTDVSLAGTSIAENNAADATIGTFNTTDVDAGSSFTYSLVAGAGDNDNLAFNISGSTLRASSVFDFETKSSYSVRVRSTDQGGLFTEKTFAITVTDVNETPTDIALSNVLIAENAGPIATVGTLSSVDPDAGNTFSYALVAGAGSTDNGAFSISGNTLRASNSFDFETKSSYTVRIR